MIYTQNLHTQNYVYTTILTEVQISRESSKIPTRFRLADSVLVRKHCYGLIKTSDVYKVAVAVKHFNIVSVCVCPR